MTILRINWKMCVCSFTVIFIRKKTEFIENLVVI